MVWDLSMDDFTNKCGGGENPIMNTIKSVLTGASPTPAPTGPSGTTRTPATATTRATTHATATASTPAPSGGGKHCHNSCPSTGRNLKCRHLNRHVLKLTDTTWIKVALFIFNVFLRYVSMISSYFFFSTFQHSLVRHQMASLQTALIATSTIAVCLVLRTASPVRLGWCGMLSELIVTGQKMYQDARAFILANWFKSNRTWLY